MAGVSGNVERRASPRRVVHRGDSVRVVVRAPPLRGGRFAGKFPSREGVLKPAAFTRGRSSKKSAVQNASRQQLQCTPPVGLSRHPLLHSGHQGTNRPREAAIRRRIMECRYKPVESLSPEAKVGCARFSHRFASSKNSLPGRSLGPRRESCPLMIRYTITVRWRRGANSISGKGTPLTQVAVWSLGGCGFWVARKYK